MRHGRADGPLLQPALSIIWLPQEELVRLLSISSEGHIFPKSGAEAAALAEAFRASITDRSAIDSVVTGMLDDQTCVGISDELRADISTVISRKFAVDRDNVRVVGSARLGISIVPKNRSGERLPRYRPFKDSSDIDVAVVDGELFDRMWKQTFLKHIAWQRYYEKSEYAQFMFKGWFRPDKLPTGFSERNNWFDFFATMSSGIHLSEMKINAGLYKSMDFLVAYQRLSVESCYNQMELDRSAT